MTATTPTYTVKAAYASPTYAFDVEWSDGILTPITYDQAVWLLDTPHLSTHSKRALTGAALASLLNPPFANH